MFHKFTVRPTMPTLIGRSNLFWIQRLAIMWEHPLWSCIQALFIYGIFAFVHGRLWSVSQNGYYNYLADAFLHGQIALRVVPPVTYDLSLYHGSYYLYWPPLPAFLIMPFVALFGIQFSDTLFNLSIGALNVAVVSALLRQAVIRRVIKLSGVRRGLLVMCFALGTVHLTLAPFGRVWNTGQLIGFLCIALCYFAVLRFHGMLAFALAGLALAAALLTRNHMVFAGLWPAYYLLYRHRSFGWLRLVVNSIIGVLPIIMAVLLLAIYDWLRFQNIWDNGLAYHHMAVIFLDDYAKYGAFNLHYLPTNVFYQYIAYPLPIRENSFMGGSLFLLTPIFVAAGVGIARMQPRCSMWALLGSIFLVAIPILLLMGTGWLQFGPRYTLDFTVPLLLLTAVGLRRWQIKTIALLLLISIVHYLLGTMHFALYL